MNLKAGDVVQLNWDVFINGCNYRGGLAKVKRINNEYGLIYLCIKEYSSQIMYFPYQDELIFGYQDIYKLIKLIDSNESICLD